MGKSFHFSGLWISHVQNKKLGLSFSSFLPTAKFQDLVSVCCLPSKQRTWFNPVSRAMTTPPATGVTPVYISNCHVPLYPDDTKGTPFRLSGPRHRAFQGHGHSNSPASIHFPLDLNGEPTDGPFMLFQAEHLGFCGCRVFLLKGVCVVHRQLWSIG